MKTTVWVPITVAAVVVVRTETCKPTDVQIRLYRSLIERPMRSSPAGEVMLNLSAISVWMSANVIRHPLEVREGRTVLLYPVPTPLR